MKKDKKIKLECQLFQEDSFILWSVIPWTISKKNIIRDFFILVSNLQVVVGLFSIGYYCGTHNLTEKEVMSLVELLEEILNEETESTDDSANKNNSATTGRQRKKICG